MTIEEAAAILLYTFDFGSTSKVENPYALVNTALVTRNILKMRNVRDFLWLLLSALRRLERVQYPLLYRGITKRVDVNKYHRSSTVIWHTFCSTTTDMQVTQGFLTDKVTKETSGTLFVVRDAWGYNIQKYSFMPGEQEIILEPELEFQVSGVLNLPLVVVELSMTPNSPLMLQKEINKFRSTAAIENIITVEHKEPETQAPLCETTIATRFITPESTPEPTKPPDSPFASRTFPLTTEPSSISQSPSTTTTTPPPSHNSSGTAEPPSLPPAPSTPTNHGDVITCLVQHDNRKYRLKVPRPTCVAEVNTQALKVAGITDTAKIVEVFEQTLNEWVVLDDMDLVLSNNVTKLRIVD
ncbi:hypothetical protein Pelo_2912 [Pelomyxa schiedti]|nr:hypothetical protein Pelo_2912 [Pelomyxa schiedti]